MSICGACGNAWFLLTVTERRELLCGMYEVVGSASVWDGVPIEVFVDTPDFDSLPHDLCGHLLLASTPTGYSIAEFRSRLSMV